MTASERVFVRWFMVAFTLTIIVIGALPTVGGAR